MRRLLLSVGILISSLVLMIPAAQITLAADAPTIAVVTPYMAQPGTQFMVEAFQAYGKQQVWTVNVIDNGGDVAAVVSRLEDVANQGVKAIVLNVDPSQVSAGLQGAKKANIPVFGMDAGTDPLLVANVTSNGYAMASETATYIVDRLDGKGNVVMFTFDPFPPVPKRGVIANAIFANNPAINMLHHVTPDVNNVA